MPWRGWQAHRLRKPLLDESATSFADNLTPTDCTTSPLAKASGLLPIPPPGASTSCWRTCPFSLLMRQSTEGSPPVSGQRTSSVPVTVHRERQPSNEESSCQQSETAGHPQPNRNGGVEEAQHGQSPAVGVRSDPFHEKRATTASEAKAVAQPTRTAACFLPLNERTSGHLSSIRQEPDASSLRQAGAVARA